MEAETENCLTEVENGQQQIGSGRLFLDQELALELKDWGRIYRVQ